MSTIVSANVNLDIMFQEVITSGIKAGPITTRFLEQYDLTNGTTDGQIDRAYANRVSGIGASVTTVYDVVGALTNTEGTAISMAEVVLVAIRNLSTTAANYLTIGPDVSNGFGVVSSNKGFWVAAIGSGGGSVVPADGYSWVVHHSRGGVPAVAATSDEIAVVTQSGTSSNTWDILILGRSA